MPVAELLSRTSSIELTEWQAYERAFGPLGKQYSDDMLAQIHEQLQLMAKLLGAALVDDANKNPIPNPQRVPRPPDLFKQPDDEEDDESDISIFDEID